MKQTFSFQKGEAEPGKEVESSAMDGYYVSPRQCHRRTLLGLTW